MTNILNSYINHIVFCVDASGSMQRISQEVIQVFDSQIQHLAQRSKELDQETRVSVYLFSDKVKCLIYDKDVLRLPSLANYYKANGGTALIDGAMKSIEDLEKTATLYGDHAFLIYTLTDGQENESKAKPAQLSTRIANLPENWTLAVLVPDQNGVHEAKKFGFPANNVQVWSTTRDGVREIGEVLKKTTDTYMIARARGIRGTKSLFTPDVSNLNKTVVKKALSELKPDQYHLLSVHQKAVIKDFIESWKIAFVPGSAYYQLTKPEKVQGYKQVAIQDKTNGKVYSGPNARALLGLPDHEVAISPAAHPNFDLFIQSLSFNRNLVGGTKLLVLK